MRIPGLKSAKRGARWLHSRIVNGALILGYHRIAEVTHDPYQMCVTPRNFAEQLHVIRQIANPVTLVELNEGLAAGAIPRRAVCVTFDDGYADVLHEAYPLLAEYEVPATVFVTTGFLGDAFWWDRLAHLVFSPPVLRDSLEMPIGDRIISLEQRDRDLPTWREVLHSTLYQRLSMLSETRRQNSLLQIRAWSGAPPEKSRLPAAVSSAEMRVLAGSNLLDLGAHTVSHPNLAHLSESQQRTEIGQSKRKIEELIGRPIIGFSYPHGSLTELTPRLVADAGYNYACSSHNDVVWRRTDAFVLPRFWIQDCGGAEFQRWLQRWLRI